MPRASQVGTLTDPMKGRVVTDEYLNTVGAGSEEATFVFKPADLERLKARREELGLGTDGQGKDAARAQAESRKAEAANADRRLANLQAEVDALKAAGAEVDKAEKSSAKTDK